LGIFTIHAFVFASLLFGGSRTTPQLADNVELPTTYEMDLSLGAKQRSEILSSAPELPEDPHAKVGAEVFSRLVTTELVSGLGPPYHWRFVEVNTSSVNATSTADGEIAAHAGLARLIGDSPGLWAAVLSHEVTHTARRHIVREVLFHMYIQQQID